MHSLLLLLLGILEPSSFCQVPLLLDQKKKNKQTNKPQVDLSILEDILNKRVEVIME